MITCDFVSRYHDLKGNTNHRQTDCDNLWLGKKTFLDLKRTKKTFSMKDTWWREQTQTQGEETKYKHKRRAKAPKTNTNTVTKTNTNKGEFEISNSSEFPMNKFEDGDCHSPIMRKKPCDLWVNTQWHSLTRNLRMTLKSHVNNEVWQGFWENLDQCKKGNLF